MSGIRPPGLGPIVGHTTDRTCRVWIRADDPADKGAALDADRRTLGLVAVLAANGKDLARPTAHYFRLHREFDRTGSFDLGVDVGIVARATRARVKAQALEPDTEYTAVLATLTLDDPFPDQEEVENDVLSDRLPPAEAWLEDLRKLGRENPKDTQAIFRTFPDSAKTQGQLGFVLGSCRYPGLLWKAKRADRIFGPMLTEVQGQADHRRGPCSLALMVGDQIYADKFNRLIPIDLADTFEEFQDRYREAFGSPHMRELLRRTPTYMILDDHEIEDNWAQDRIRDAAKRRLFNLAIGAYMSYQWSHSPRNWGRRLYYKFDCGGYPFFVLDTRTQRYLDDVADDLGDNHLLGRPALGGDEPNQLSRLLDWLKQQQATRKNIPKFIVSSSVFVPNPMSARVRANIKKLEGSDSWPAFPTTRRALLDCIVENRIQNVVFLSGDIHCSNVAAMRFSGSPDAEKLRAFSVTSSALYWPFPFADGDPSDYVHNSREAGQEDSFELSNGITMDYEAWNFTQEDNYCRIDLDRTKTEIRVRAFNDDGTLIRREIDDGDGPPIDSTLKLAPW